MKTYLNNIIISILMTFLFAGCGGGGTSTVPSVNTPEGISVTNPTPSVNTAGKPGVFKIVVYVPSSQSSKDMTGSVIPYLSTHLWVSITGEAIGTAITGGTAITAGYTELTIPNVPVGLNVATIEVRTAPGGGGNLLAQRKHGFFMPSGGTAGVGSAGAPFSMGVAIQGGACVPANIDIPTDTILFFENQDSVQRTVATNPASISADIYGVTPSGQPDTPATYHAVSHTFGTAGTYNYTNPSASGRVLVYGVPHMTAISDNDSEPIENIDINSITTFTISGSGFGTDRAMVGGQVLFYRVDDLLHEYYDWDASFISNWTDTSITLSDIPGASLSKGKYRVKVRVRGTYTPENDFYYYIGSGNYVITVE